MTFHSVGAVVNLRTVGSRNFVGDKPFSVAFAEGFAQKCSKRIGAEFVTGVVGVSAVRHEIPAVSADFENESVKSLANIP